MCIVEEALCPKHEGGGGGGALEQAEYTGNNFLPPIEMWGMFTAGPYKIGWGGFKKSNLFDKSEAEFFCFFI